MKIRFILRNKVVAERVYPFKPAVGDYAEVMDGDYVKSFVIVDVIFNTQYDVIDVVLN